MKQVALVASLSTRMTRFETMLRDVLTRASRRLLHEAIGEVAVASYPTNDKSHESIRFW